MTAFTGEVHPFADWYPMLPETELQELADDIKANGLRQPITLNADGVLIDGRNRLAACALAGVQPVFAVTAEEPFALIRSANNRRRKLTAGMVAVTDAVAMRALGLWDDKAGRWKYGALTKVADATFASDTDIKRAGAVLAHSEDLAREVVTGTLGLRAAYDKVQADKAAAAERERRHQEMQDKAPDILAKMGDDFTFEMAWAAYQERDKERIKQEAERVAFICDWWKRTESALLHLSTGCGVTGRYADEYGPIYQPREPFTVPELLDDVIAGLLALKEDINSGR